MSSNHQSDTISSDTKPFQLETDRIKLDDVDALTQVGFLTVDPNNDEFRINRGKALIISNNYYGCGDLERQGNKSDRNSVVSLLKSIGCDITIIEDEIVQNKETDENGHNTCQVIALTKAKIMSTIRDLSTDKNLDLINYDCLIIFIMCHGTLNKFNEECIETVSGSVNVKWIYESFSNNKCKSLIGKPKLFFLQHCRGGKKDRGVITKFVPCMVSNSTSTISADSSTSESIAKMSEYFIANASFEGYEAYLTSAGSWFIQELVNVFKTKIPQGMEIHHMMLKVHRNISKLEEREKDLFQHQTDQMQIPNENIVKSAPCIKSTLTKPVYFRITSSENQNEDIEKTALYSPKHLDFFESKLGNSRLHFFEA